MKIEFLAAYATVNRIESPEAAEAAVVEVLYRVARSVGPRFRFGYLDNEDAIQQAVYFGLEAIESGKYDVTMPMENFMRFHMRNYMHNYKRDNFSRTASPCQCCSTDYPPESPCDVFRKWLKRNGDKKSLTQANSYGIDQRTCEDSATCEVEFAEVIARIDDVLPMEYRADYLRMRDGVVVSKARREKIKEFVRGVIADAETENR